MNRFWLYIIIISILDVLGGISGKLWQRSQNDLYLALSIIIFAAVGFFFALLMKYETMAIVNILWIAFSTLLFVIAGLLVFNEKVGPLQVIGMVIVAIGIILIEWKR